MLSCDFVIQVDENGQRFAYPTGAKGDDWFRRNITALDVSERGVELDTSADAYDTFVAGVVVEDGLTVIEVSS